MNDYLNSIKNIDDIGTSTDIEIQQELPEAVPVIEMNVEVPSITRVEDETQEEQVDSNLAPYMELNKVIVKKYRLKK